MFEGFDPFLNLSCTLVWLDFRTLGLLGHWPRDTRCGFQLELQLGSSLNLESQVGFFFSTPTWRNLVSFFIWVPPVLHLVDT